MAGTLDDMRDIVGDKSPLNFEEGEKRQMEKLQSFFTIAV